MYKEIRGKVMWSGRKIKQEKKIIDNKKYIYVLLGIRGFAFDIFDTDTKILMK